MEYTNIAACNYCSYSSYTIQQFKSLLLLSLQQCCRDVVLIHSSRFLFKQVDRFNVRKEKKYDKEEKKAQEEEDGIKSSNFTFPVTFS